MCVCVSVSVVELAWGPAELAAAEHVDVQVEHSLSGVHAVIDDNAEAVDEVGLFGNLSRNHKQVSKQLWVTHKRLIKR